MQRERSDYTFDLLIPVLGKMLGAEVNLSTWLGSVRALGFEKLKTVLWENRIVVRGYESVNRDIPQDIDAWLRPYVNEHVLRGKKILQYMGYIMEVFNFDFVFIKTPDNYPDFGHDIDVLTLDNGKTIEKKLIDMGFRKLKQTLAERIADKINFLYKDFCSLEMHCGRIGEFGEHKKLAIDIITHKKIIKLSDVEICAPDYISRVFLITLQRLYRHFNLRACDVYNVITWYKNAYFDPGEVIEKAKNYGIDFGVTWLLRFVNEIYFYFFQQPLFELPRLVPSNELYCANNLIRFNRKKFLPLIYGQRLGWDLINLKFEMLFRESLFVPVSILALMYLKVFKKEGIW